MTNNKLMQQYKIHFLKIIEYINYNLHTFAFKVKDKKNIYIFVSNSINSYSYTCLSIQRVITIEHRILGLPFTLISILGYLVIWVSDYANLQVLVSPID